MANEPNILVLHSDEHSFRYLSARSRERGGEPVHTPTLDGLIRKGVHFDATYCQMPLCTPSRISMFTGRHSHRCGAWGNGSVLPPELPTFGSHLREHGYATTTIGKMHIGGSRQMAGFGSRPYGDFGGPCAHQLDPLSRLAVEGGPGMGMRSRTVDAGLSEIPEAYLQENVVARTAVAWAREQEHASPDQPWLLYTSFSRPHFPLTAPKRHLDRYYPEGVSEPRVLRSGDGANHPMTEGMVKGFQTEEIEPEEGKKGRASYFACVDFLDEMLGDFLATMEHAGLLEDTVILYVSDHGEMAGEHGLWWKNTWHESSSRVPMIISTPEHRSGEQPASEVTQPTSLADIFPTLCDIAQVPLPDGLDGTSLAPALKGETPTEVSSRIGVVTENLTPRWGAGTEFRMIRSDRYKYIAFRGCDDLAFDIESDPDEQVNIASTPAFQDALAPLRDALLKDFSFDEAEKVRSEQTADLKNRFPAKFQPETPNQIVLGDGRLVEADALLYNSEVLSKDLENDLDHTQG
jgi:choline-sulfatase